jgi:hypothetical protein
MRHGRIEQCMYVCVGREKGICGSREGSKIEILKKVSLNGSDIECQPLYNTLFMSYSSSARPVTKLIQFKNTIKINIYSLLLISKYYLLVQELLVNITFDSTGITSSF